MSFPEAVPDSLTSTLHRYSIAVTPRRPRRHSIPPYRLTALPFTLVLVPLTPVLVPLTQFLPVFHTPASSAPHRSQYHSVGRFSVPHSPHLSVFATPAAALLTVGMVCTAGS